MSIEPKSQEISEQDLAWYIRTFWTSITSADWPKDDLIEMGKLAYAKTPVKDIPDKIFLRLLPHLRKVATTFATLTNNRAPAAPPAADEATEKTSETTGEPPREEPSRG